MQEGTTSTKHRECVSNTTAHNPTLLNTHAHIQQEMKKERDVENFVFKIS